MPTQLPAVCGQCGQPESEAASCAVCGASLLVDLHAVGSSEKQRYLGAKALAELGPPLPALALIRARLDKPGERVVGPVSRSFARRALATAQQAGLDLEARTASPLGVARQPPPLRPLFVVALLGAVAALVVLQVRRARQPPPVIEELAPVAAASSAAAPTPAVAPLSAAKIGDAALGSVASLECPDSRGAGFFIEPDLLVTNAHVLCHDGSNLKVHLHDGRDLIGVVKEKNTEQDWAKVSVLGAAVTPLPVGDPLALKPGDRAVIIGSPHGLAFTLHEAEVSFVGRNVLGVAFIQLNATINPGNSGGPLVDDQGRVVGIVSLKMLDTEGIGMALPMSYVVPPSTAESLQKWSAMLAEVEAADAKEVERFRADADHPLLVGAGEDGHAVLVLEHSRQAPSSVDLPLELSDADGHSCQVTSHIEAWVPFSEALQHEADSPRIRWLKQRAAGNEMFVGAGWIDASACAQHTQFSEAEGRLTLKGDGESRGQARVQIGSVLAGRPRSFPRR